LHNQVEHLNKKLHTLLSIDRQLRDMDF